MVAELGRSGLVVASGYLRRLRPLAPDHRLLSGHRRFSRETSGGNSLFSSQTSAINSVFHVKLGRRHGCRRCFEEPGGRRQHGRRVPCIGMAPMTPELLNLVPRETFLAAPIGRAYISGPSCPTIG